MTKQIKILYSDDDNRYAKPFIDWVYNEYQIELDHYKNWEEAYSSLVENFNDYHAIILDGKGQKTADSKSDDFSHVTQAIGDIRELQGKHRYIPYVVHSKYIEVKEAVDHELFFIKGDDDEKMFGFLENEIENLESRRIELKYESAFEVFEKGIIDKKYESILFDIFKCLENSDYKKKNLNVVRDLLEAIFLTLINNYECIPDSFLNSRGNPNQQLCALFFLGKEVKDSSEELHKIPFKIPGHISSTIMYIKEVSNGFSHLNENDIVKNPFISSVYGMLEVLEWLPKFVEVNFEE